jgi:hypothetical protein
MMNWSEIRDDWEPMQVLLKSCWPALTAGDLADIDGDRARLAEVLRARYELSFEGAEEEICTFEAEIRRPGAVK